jgi:tRNA-2-methylthio-N6-dimethylallyladenosine synthase
MNKNYFIKTFGCQMNVSDSERISGFLESKGYKSAQSISEAALVVFNTCGIKQTAENRAYSFIHNLRKHHNDVKIILTGCIAHRSDVQKLLKNKVDLFFSISDMFLFENWIIENCLEIGNWKLEIPAQNNLPKENIAYLSIAPKHNNKYQAFVPIMTGCDNFCAYCVVPHARGREVSRPAEEILAEVQDLVKKGYKHITLLGQNVNSYKSTADFPQLLKKIDRIPGKFWVSFVSSHPKDFSDELIGIIARCKKVCEWIHLPVQAGNDAILQKMNRRYTQAHYLKLLGKIRQAMKKHKPRIPYSLSSDIIVGFPGETRKQFADSAKIMEKARFDMVFFGQFSPRPGTAAWQMKDDVAQKEKARREKFLNEILKKTTLANNKKYVGKIMEVLVEKEKDGVYFGKTRTMKNVKILSAKKDLIGKIIKVKITKVNIWNLEGEII